MPIIELKCEKCNKVYSFLIPKEKLTEKCKCSGKLKKIFSKSSFQIDGIVY